MAALGFVVADHGFASIAIVLWCIAAVVFGVGVLAALLDLQAEGRRTQEAAEDHRRDAIIKRLRQDYCRAHPMESIGITMGWERLPKAWVDEQLEKLGETWRRDTYH